MAMAIIRAAVSGLENLRHINFLEKEGITRNQPFLIKS